MTEPVNNHFPRLENFSENEIWEALKSNQDGDARLFIKLNKGKFCFDHSTGTWFKFNGNFWEEDKVQEVYDGFKRLIDVYSGPLDKFSIQSNEACKDGDDETSSIFEKKRALIKKRISSLQTMHRKRAVLQLASQCH